MFEITSSLQRWHSPRGPTPEWLAAWRRGTPSHQSGWFYAGGAFACNIGHEKFAEI